MKPSKDGTLKEHLQQVEKQTGQRLEQLHGPDFPSCMSYVWSVFLSLNDARTIGQATANPLTYEAIKAFMDITHTVLSPRDVETIKKIDGMYLSIMNAPDKSKD